MSNQYIHLHSQADFDRARKKALINRLANFFQSHKHDLLSLDEVKEMLSPQKETYRGIQVVPINLIIGSEGRYQDFNKEFFPRHNHLKHRWLNIDRLHLKNIILPPVQLYEVGGVYFVRDGNHRVSVARSQGVEMIDAEVVSLDSIIDIHPNMDKIKLKKAIISYEQNCFEEKTHFSSIIPNTQITFTSTGRYNELLLHILEHKYFINQNKEEEILLNDAIRSWFEYVYTPIINVLEEYNVLSHFPKNTKSDLYIWTSKQWHALKIQYGQDIEIKQAADDVILEKKVRKKTSSPLQDHK